MPNREAKDNTTQAFDAIHYAHSENIDTLLLSADAEKAFDKVDRGFMKADLHYISLGAHMKS